MDKLKQRLLDNCPSYWLMSEAVGLALITSTSYCPLMRSVYHMYPHRALKKSGHSAQIKEPCLGQEMGGGSFHRAQEDFTHMSSDGTSHHSSLARIPEHLRFPRCQYSGPVGGVCYPNCTNKETELHRVYVMCQSHTARKWQSRD